MKMVTYGLMHLVVAIAVAFALTRNLKAALAIVLLEPFIQTIAYTIHEKVWQRLRLNRVQECENVAVTPALTT